MNAGFNLFFFLCCNFLANSFYLCKIIDGFKTVSSLLGFLGANVCCLRVFLAPTAALSFSENSVSREELAACLQRTSWSPYLFACARFLTDTDSVVSQVIAAISCKYCCGILHFSTNFGFVCLRACYFSRTLGCFRDCCYFIVLAVRLWISAPMLLPPLPLYLHDSFSTPPCLETSLKNLLVTTIGWIIDLYRGTTEYHARVPLWSPFLR